MSTTLVPSPTTSRAAPRSHPRWALLAVAAVGVAVLLPESLAADARLALFAFGAATAVWTLTRLDAGFVALAAGLLACVGAGRQEEFFAALGHEVVWLILGAFVLGGALAASGLAARATTAIIGRARSVGSLLWLVTAAIVPLSFLIPSTSGRAAVLLPVHRALAEELGDRRIARALSLLIPSVVLVATTATLVGATSHLVAVDLLAGSHRTGISYAQWALWGLPFALAASALVCFLVGRMFLRPEDRRRALPAPARTAEGPAGLSREERTVALVAAASLLGWLTEPLHGVSIAVITVIAALVLCAPGIGVLTWKEGIDAVSWRLVLFVAGALALGSALVSSGAGEWIIGSLLEATGAARVTSPLLAVVIIAVLSTTAHLYITSHTVRAIVLVPPFLHLAAATDLSPVAVVFLLSIGLDYCLTLPASSKALLVFADADEDGTGFDPGDLLRLSAVMLPLYIALMVVMHQVWWAPMGAGV